MIIDEIGRKSEADAPRTAASRGVRLIATAHGSFRSLLGNPDTNGLLGGVSNVVLGDEYAKSKMEDGSQSNFRESRAERLSNPVFDVAVELGVGANAECTVIMNTAEAVDRILAGKRYKVQRRNWTVSPRQSYFSLIESRFGHPENSAPLNIVKTRKQVLEASLI